MVLARSTIFVCTRHIFQMLADLFPLGCVLYLETFAALSYENAKRKEVINKSANMTRGKEFRWKDKVAIKNCEKSATNSKKLQARS